MFWASRTTSLYSDPTNILYSVSNDYMQAIVTATDDDFEMDDSFSYSFVVYDLESSNRLVYPKYFIEYLNPLEGVYDIEILNRKNYIYCIYGKSIHLLQIYKYGAYSFTNGDNECGVRDRISSLERRRSQNFSSIRVDINVKRTLVTSITEDWKVTCEGNSDVWEIDNDYGLCNACTEFSEMEDCIQTENLLFNLNHYCPVKYPTYQGVFWNRSSCLKAPHPKMPVKWGFSRKE